MKILQVIVLSVILSTVGRAQLLTLGLQGGVPAQTSLERSNTKMPFVLGPTVTLKLFSNLSLESGVLFHCFGESRDTFGFQYPEGGFTMGSNEWRAKAIELPFLLKYRFLSESRGWQPFLTAGPTVRRTSIDFTGFHTAWSGNPLNPSEHQPIETNNSTKWNVDPAVGAGVSFRSGRLRIEPEVRYSYWGAGKHTVIRQNQVHFLFGLRF